MAENDSRKRKKPTQPTLHDILSAGRDMMNRSKAKMGSYAEEDRRFREMFGVGPLVALTAWSMLTTLGLLPDGGTLIRYLWALCFMKVYAKQGPMCVLCGGVDHKTLKKWVKAFVMALADLESHVVRLII